MTLELNYNTTALNHHLFLKTLLSQEEIQKGLNAVKQQIVTKDTAQAFYISLLATNEKGGTEKEHFLFDVASSLELCGYNVHFKSTKDLEIFFNSNKDASSSLNTYELALNFIRQHPGSSFFLDEVPFIKVGYGKWSNSSIVA